MNVLITGATGFVGHHLIKKLIDNQYSPIALVRRTSDLNRINYPGVEYRYIEDGLSTVFNGNDITGIIHVATSYGQNGLLSEILEANVIYPLKLIEEGINHNIKFFINTDTFFTKSIGTYQHLSNYTTSKNLLFSFIKNFSASLKVINVKLEHVYGENDGEQKFISHILKRIINNESQIDLTEGLQRRDFIYIEDVTNAYLLLLNNIEKLDGFTQFEVGTGKSTSIKELVCLIRDLTKSTSQLNFGALPTREGEFEESKADNIALKELGWKYEFTIEAGLNRIIHQQKL